MLLHGKSKSAIVLIAVLAVGVAGYFAYNQYLDHSDPRRLPQRLFMAGEYDQLLEMALDHERPIVQRRFAANRLANVRSFDTVSSDFEAKVLNLRDTSKDSGILLSTEWILRYLNKEKAESLLNQLLDDVRAILIEARPIFPNRFDKLQEGEAVDLVIHLSKGTAEEPFPNKLGLDHLLKVYRARSSAEIEAIAASIQRVGVVVSFRLPVGTYEGVDVECTGKAYRRYADVYLVDVTERKIMAVARESGKRPPNRITVESGTSDPCSGSGQGADTGRYFVEKDWEG